MQPWFAADARDRRGRCRRPPPRTDLVVEVEHQEVSVADRPFQRLGRGRGDRGRWLARRSSTALDGDDGERPRGSTACSGAPLDDDTAELALRAAIAVELVHSASLVHDDLPCFDDAALRRGAPTVHRSFGQAMAVVTVGGEQADLELTIDEQGSLRACRLSRWGNPEGGECHWVDFGGYADGDQTFGGYTIPTQVRVGWYFGSERFEEQGEFFRATLEDVQYR